MLSVHKLSITGAVRWIGVLTSLTCAVAATPIQFITSATFTSKKSWHVQTASIDTDVSEGTFVYVCKRDRERENDEEVEESEWPSCEGLVDHGIMVENLQPAIGSEGHSPLLKNDSSGAKNAQAYPDRHTHTLSEQQPRLWNCALPHH